MKLYTLIFSLFIFSLNSFSQSDLTEVLKLERVFETVEEIPTSRNYNKIVCSKISSFESDKRFNAKVENSVNEYFCAYFEGEAMTRELGFYKKPSELIGTYKIDIEPQVKFSRNGNYIVVVGMYNDYILLFEKTGNLLFESKSNEILNSNNNLFNAFIDNSGALLIINNSYHLSLYNIKEKELKWSEKYDTRRIRDCIFFKDKNIVAIKSLTPREKMKTKDEKYSLLILSLTNGEILGELIGISSIDKLETILLVEKDEKLYEYSINYSNNL